MRNLIFIDIGYLKEVIHVSTIQRCFIGSGQGETAGWLLCGHLDPEVRTVDQLTMTALWHHGRAGEGPRHMGSLWWSQAGLMAVYLETRHRMLCHFGATLSQFGDILWIPYPYREERRDIRSNIPLCLKEFPRAKPEGTPYILSWILTQTVYHSLQWNTEIKLFNISSEREVYYTEYSLGSIRTNCQWE